MCYIFVVVVAARTDVLLLFLYLVVVTVVAVCFCLLVIVIHICTFSRLLLSYCSIYVYSSFAPTSHEKKIKQETTTINMRHATFANSCIGNNNKRHLHANSSCEFFIISFLLLLLLYPRCLTLVGPPLLVF